MKWPTFDQILGVVLTAYVSAVILGFGLLIARAPWRPK
jgi:hypothetical protein